ncbi:MAG: hypothetical protein DRQ10_00450 [Candidatus Hydrothermota bacterium]|nr:MAG: hypothetical protein DRQ10_00450 [Candidatus Hydrothermae bacterium]
MRSNILRLKRRAYSARFDPFIAVPVAVLTVIGIVVVYSSSFYISAREFGMGTTHFYFLMRHITALLVGVVALFVLSAIPSEELLKWSRMLIVMLIGSVIALLLFGKTVAGAKRWFRIASFGFQPSELAKVILVLYLADYIGRKQVIASFKKELLPPLIVILMVVVPVAFQPSVSMAFLLMAISLTTLFYGNLKLRYIFVLSLIVAAFFILLYKTFPHARMRLHMFLGEKPYQVRQAMAALAEGGIFGVGVGKGIMKFLYLPTPHTDFIYAVIGEEMGFVGSSIVVLMFALIAMRGYRLAGELMLFGRRYLADSVLAFGLTTAIVLTAFINISIVLGKLPPTGIPMPFISYGGSAALANFSAVGILLSLSSKLNRLKAERLPV